MASSELRTPTPKSPDPYSIKQFRKIKRVPNLNVSALTAKGESVRISSFKSIELTHAGATTEQIEFGSTDYPRRDSTILKSPEPIVDLN